MDWLPEPPAETAVTLGLDGSDSDDWTALRARTQDGFGFTPRHGEGEPTIWIPAEHNGKIPRTQVNLALTAIRERFRVIRFYYDPFGWTTEGEEWQAEFGETVAIPWATNRTRQMHEALVRYHTDLTNKRFTHDGCPLTALAMDNARKVPRGDRYILGKPSQHQKIDPTMSEVLAHEAWCDATAANEWQQVDDLPPLTFGF